MGLAANIAIGLVMVEHVYFMLLETVLFRTRGVKTFGVAPADVETLAPAMSNQGCYNGFLAAALALAVFYPNPAIAHAFALYGLACVVVAGLWGAATVAPRIALIQGLPAAIGLGLVWLGA